MSYLMIQNRGEIPIKGIRLLGMSHKTDEQIGQFGTGLKEAIALLARKQIGLTIYSGETRIEFSTQNIDGDDDEIVYRIDAGDWQPMNLHVNFGRRDWTDIWQALREIICNAIDEGLDDMHYDVVGEQSGAAGATRVYVDADFEVLEQCGQLPKRLLMLSKREPLFSNHKGSIYAKDGSDKAQIYHRGVWVQESPEASLFDYDLPDILLNESRSASWFECHWETSRLLAMADASIIARLLTESQREGFRDTYEGKNLRRDAMEHAGNGEAWRAAWSMAFGPNAVACYPSEHLFFELVRKGYDAKAFETSWFKLFREVGIPTHDDKLNEFQQQPVRLVPDKKCPVFGEVWDALQRRGFVDDKPMPSVSVFRQTDTDGGRRMHGYTTGDEIYINEDVLGSREERVTCLEEAAHYISGKADTTIDLQNWLMDKLDRALFEAEVEATP